MDRCAGLSAALWVLALGALACAESVPLEPENQAPTAYAGAHRTQYDLDGDGSERVSLDGSSSSDRDGTIVSYVWLEGSDTLATLASPEVDLALGVHGITLVVTDDESETGSAFVWIAVRPSIVNRPPSARILSPTDGSEYFIDDHLLLKGMGSDLDEGQLVGNRLRWAIDGQFLGWGIEVGTYDLAAGIHRVTLTAIDSEGARDTASITVSVFVSFSENVLPIFQRSCVDCHGPERAEGGIRLDSYEAITTGENRNGPLVVAGDPTQGILIRKLLAEDNDYDHVLDAMGVIVNEWIVETYLVPWILDGLPNN